MDCFFYVNCLLVGMKRSIFKHVRPLIFKQKSLGSWSMFMKFYILILSVRNFIEIQHVGSNVCEIRAMIM